jgi:hypothetical protein
MRRKFRKISIVVEAEQWFGISPPVSGFGVVREWQPDPNTQPQNIKDEVNRICQWCGMEMKYHGVIDTPEGTHIVCVQDWIVQGHSDDMGVHYWPVKPDYFKTAYEEVF